MRTPKRKIAAILLIIFILAIAAAGAVFGYLSAGSGQVNNTFVPATDADPTVVVSQKPTASPTSPTEYAFSVNIGNPGYAVYVRVAVVVTWENTSGNVYGQMPVDGLDYSMTWDSTNWFQDDNGFYYHRAMVTSNDELAQLITSVSELSTATPPEGYSLHVEVIAQTIQALGTADNGDTPAVTDAWGIEVDPATKQLVAPD